jgi:hypothetical protein
VPQEITTRGVVVHLKDGNGGSVIVGEVIIHPSTLIADVRHMIRDELGVSSPFVLRKCEIPLPRNIDSKKAGLFFSSKDEYLIVEKK